MKNKTGKRLFISALSDAWPCQNASERVCLASKGSHYEEALLANGLGGLKEVQSPCPPAILSLYSHPPKPTHSHLRGWHHSCPRSHNCMSCLDPSPTTASKDIFNCMSFHLQRKCTQQKSAARTPSWERNSGDFLHLSITPKLCTQTNEAC